MAPAALIADGTLVPLPDGYTTVDIEDLIELAESALQPTDVGIGANKIVKSNSSGQLPAFDGSLLTDVVTYRTFVPDPWPYFYNGSNGQGGGPDPKNIRIRRRVLMGQAADVDDYRTNVPGFGVRPNWGDAAMWIPGDSDFCCISRNGVYAVSGMSRTSDKAGLTSPTPGTSALVGYVKNDAAGAFGRAIYLEAQRESGAGGTPIIEAVGKNKGDSKNSTAYTPENGVEGAWFVAGGDPAYGGVPANPCNTAISFRGGVLVASVLTYDVNYAWNKGLVFDRFSIAGTDGSDADTGTGVAIELAKQHAIVWRRPVDNGVGAFIRSNKGTASGQSGGILFDTNGTYFTNAANNAFGFHVQTVSSGVNYLSTLSAVTGGVAVLRAASDVDADVAVSIRGKGTFGGSLRDGADAQKVAWNTTGLGFFGTTPVAKPTGVAVSAAGVHAALVTLGLIAA